MNKEADLKDYIDKVRNFFTFSIDDFSDLVEEKKTPAQVEQTTPQTPQEEPVEVPIPSVEREKEPEKEEYVAYSFDPRFGEVEVIEYKPEEPFPRMGEPGVDHSLPVLKYLKSLGYKYCIWNLSEEHNFFSHWNACGVDPCEENDGKEFSIDDLLNFSYQHAGGGQIVCNEAKLEKLKSMQDNLSFLMNNKWYKPPEEEVRQLRNTINEMNKGVKVERWGPYSPPSPLFAMSHPKCLCGLFVLNPQSIDDIPEGAPGMPFFSGNSDILKAYKEKIWNNMKALPDDGVYVHSYTLPPIPGSSFTEEVIMKGQEPEEQRMYSSKKTPLYKYAEGGWVTDIIPIAINKNIYVKHPIGILQPVMENMYGFKVKLLNEVSAVYLVDMNHIVYVPSSSLRELTLIEDTPNFTEIKRGDYVLIDDDTLGIVFNILNNDDVVAYIPEYGELASIDEFRKMKIV